MAAGEPIQHSEVVKLTMNRSEYQKFKKMVYEVEKKVGMHMDLDEALHYIVFKLKP